MKKLLLIGVLSVVVQGALLCGIKSDLEDVAERVADYCLKIPLNEQAVTEQAEKIKKKIQKRKKELYDYVQQEDGIEKFKKKYVKDENDKRTVGRVLLDECIEKLQEIDEGGDDKSEKKKKMIKKVLELKVLLQIISSDEINGKLQQGVFISEEDWQESTPVGKGDEYKRVRSLFKVWYRSFKDQLAGKKYDEFIAEAQKPVVPTSPEQPLWRRHPLGTAGILTGGAIALGAYARRRGWTRYKGLFGISAQLPEGLVFAEVARLRGLQGAEQDFAISQLHRYYSDSNVQLIMQEFARQEAA